MIFFHKIKYGKNLSPALITCRIYEGQALIHPLHITEIIIQCWRYRKLECNPGNFRTQGGRVAG